MPGGDGTGPLGRGPFTGWGRGLCSTDSSRRWLRGGGGGRRNTLRDDGGIERDLKLQIGELKQQLARLGKRAGW